MRIALSIILLLILLSVSIVFYHKDKDILSPIVVLCLLCILRYCPGIAYIEDNLFIKIDQEAAVITFIYFLISFFCTTMGYLYYCSMNFKEKYTVTLKRCYNTKSFVIVCYLIGLIAGVIWLAECDFNRVIQDGVKEIHAGNGKSYIRGFTFLIVISISCILGVQKKVNSIFLLTIILLYIGYAFTYIVLTSRSPVLEGVMVLFFVYHYRVKRVHIVDVLNYKTILFLIIGMLYIMIMPYVRANMSVADISKEDIVEQGFNKITNIFDEFCYVGRESFIYKNYNRERYWYGANMINLIASPIPSTVFSKKPPVDDGMYLANAVMGDFISPPHGDFPWYNSFPLSTPGGLFINFGLLGLTIGSFLLGMFYAKFYRILKETDYDIGMIIIYQSIIYQFELSSLSIVQTLTPIIYLIVTLKIGLGWKLRKESVLDSSTTDKLDCKENGFANQTCIPRA